ncbi:hypothetical protein BCR32DRAFT_267932 [Anaeromyces robustus]|uniref:Uncharacterized protein n=1 Tax=Anaeromyces robustus TaxID=1754192 RepID=A0A1Y1X8E8_9FUNG|nr:hypothetical protein BCR32DRAFT_267932 [Anaeromyces robustus]|eukprot:ORX82030.1 hypothetical protein BCR32DRAFT_267932 [Anaeromyces robustus]
MIFRKLLPFIFIYFILINIVYAKNFKLSKRSITEEKKCKNLNNKNIKIKHYTYSFLNKYSIVFTNGCYLQEEDEIVICNDNYHFTYIFYLQQNIYKEFYGSNKEGLNCKHNDTQIVDWNFYDDEGKSLIFNSDNQVQGNEFNKFNENHNYTFQFIFENQCTYNIKLDKVQYVKSFRRFVCNKEEKEE